MLQKNDAIVTWIIFEILATTINPKSFLTMLSPKTLKNCHFLYKYQISEKYHFWTHATIGFCNNLDQEDA